MLKCGDVIHYEKCVFIVVAVTADGEGYAAPVSDNTYNLYTWAFFLPSTPVALNILERVPSLEEAPRMISHLFTKIVKETKNE